MDKPKYFNKRIPRNTYPDPLDLEEPLPGQIDLEELIKLDQAGLFTNPVEEEELPAEFTTI